MIHIFIFDFNRFYTNLFEEFFLSGDMFWQNIYSPSHLLDRPFTHFLNCSLGDSYCLKTRWSYIIRFNIQIHFICININWFIMEMWKSLIYCNTSIEHCNSRDKRLKFLWKGTKDVKSHYTWNRSRGSVLRITFVITQVVTRKIWSQF